MNIHPWLVEERSHCAIFSVSLPQNYECLALPGYWGKCDGILHDGFS